MPSDSILYRLATDSLVMEVETYSWYAEGYRYPVFETVKSRNIISHKPEDYFATAFFYPPREHEYLESDPLNKKIVEDNKGKEDNPLAGCTFNVFPNPADYILNVEIYLPVEAKIEIQMRPVVTKNVCINENKGKFKPGIHSFQLNV